jgi:hypothetical protein
MTLSEKTAENGGYLQCLSELQDFIMQTTEGENTPTVREIKTFFITAKIAERKKILEILQTELDKLKIINQ